MAVQTMQKNSLVRAIDCSRMRDGRDLGDPERTPLVRYDLLLLISCPDKKGLIAAISSFISMHDGNILPADRYVSDSGTFFMRLEIEGEGFGLGRDEFAGAFAPLARQHNMDWRVSRTDTPKRMAILVSRYDHRPIDLLWRWDAGELDAEIALVISNHPDLASRTEHHGIPFHHLPVTKETKAEQESKTMTLLFECGVKLVVLARYMQILSPDFVSAFPSAIINIHHSFLPAFPGADPYRRATRGALRRSARPPTTSRTSSTPGRSSTRTSPT
jgi:formyltetrahydrofolate deformylase